VRVLPNFSGPAEMAVRLAAFGSDDNEDELTTTSNAVVDLVHEAKLDEAEQVARDLIVQPVRRRLVASKQPGLQHRVGDVVGQR
jgi:hypothetical protein